MTGCEIANRDDKRAKGIPTKFLFLRRFDKHFYLDKTRLPPYLDIKLTAASALAGDRTRDAGGSRQPETTMTDQTGQGDDSNTSGTRYASADDVAGRKYGKSVHVTEKNTGR
ncbi:hypothetical protein Scep_002290 [Stephania cephalantha]|uniref:Uncharacterized protein n=1 Tax=Stephania cephalantha TaxID=152367 RepID=A0AAP0LDP5_9MAGN